MSVASLETMEAPVIAMRPPTDQPVVMVGASLSSPVGPAIAVGAGCTLPGQSSGLCLVAHLQPDDAIALASKLMAAAAIVLEAQGKGGVA